MYLFLYYRFAYALIAFNEIFEKCSLCHIFIEIIGKVDRYLYQCHSLVAKSMETALQNVFSTIEDTPNKIDMCFRYYVKISSIPNGTVRYLEMCQANNKLKGKYVERQILKFQYKYLHDSK